MLNYGIILSVYYKNKFADVSIQNGDSKTEKRNWYGCKQKGYSYLIKLIYR